MPTNQIYLQTLQHVAKTRIYKHAGAWAEENRIYPSDAAIPGKFDISYTPYLDAIFEAVESYKYKIIVVMMASQLGKTDGFCLNVIGKTFDCEPVPIIFVMPDQKMAEAISNDRFDKMLITTPSLWDKLSKGKKNKVTEKFVNGARISFAWASSASQLCSSPSAKAFMDELDRMPDNVDNEGDPFEVVSARTKNYINAKIILTSSPTIKGASKIVKHYDVGTRCKFCLPCPFCQQHFFPTRATLQWEEINGEPTKFFLVCPECKKEISEEHRSTMLQKGKYIAENPASKVASFWVTGLCSYWVTWSDAGNKIFSAEKSGDINRIQSVINTFFGEPYELRGESIQPKIIADLRRPYRRGNVINDIEILTCGVDVHKNNLYWVVRGWGKGDKSWLVANGIILGDTLTDTPWQVLERLVLSQIGQKPIRLVCIDAGYRDAQVYTFCKRIGIAAPCKGYLRQFAPIRMARINYYNGQVDKKLCCIDDSYFKTLMMSKIIKKNWFVPEDVEDIYIKQITAEKMIIDKRGRQIWECEDRDNHYLDCEKLNMVAASILRVDLLDKPQENKKSTIIAKEINPYDY